MSNRRYIHLLLLLPLLLFAFSCVDHEELLAPTEEELITELAKGVAEGYLIGFDTTPDKSIVKAAGGNVIRQYNNFPVIHANVPEQSLQGLRLAPGVSFVEPNGVVTTLDHVDDICPMASDVCAHGRIKTINKSQIGAQPAWDNSAGDGIRLAILDTGIERDLEDLVDNVADDGISFAGGSHLRDIYGHGSHVAGIAGASGIAPNDFTLVGTAPEVTLVSVKVLNNGGSGSSANVAAGIDWCIDNDIDIINMSLGGSEYSEALEEAVQAAWDEGLLLVAAAGNSGTATSPEGNVAYPAAFDDVIAVTAGTWMMTDIAGFSSTGPEVELIAPGVAIFSTYPGRSWEYAYMSGTSMAAPHVAGVAALVWSYNNELENSDVRQILQTTAEDLEFDPHHQGYGLVRADDALGMETGNISGVVIDAANDEAIYTANVIAEGEGTSYSTNTAGHAGYTLYIPPGDYTVTASFEHYGYISVTEDITINADEAIEINFELESEDDVPVPTYIVSGTVTDIDGIALEGATVTIEGTSHSDVTGNDGSYQIADVDEGAYNITASKAGYESETQNVTVDGDITVNFTLETEVDEPVEGEPEIVAFEVSTRTTGPWLRADVEWEVSHEDNALDSVTSELLDGGVVIGSQTTSVSGGSASGEHNLRTRDDAESVRLTVRDTEGNEVSEVQSLD